MLERKPAFRGSAHPTTGHTLGLVAHGSASTASLVTTSRRVWAALGPQVELLEAGGGTKPPIAAPRRLPASLHRHSRAGLGTGEARDKPPPRPLRAELCGAGSPPLLSPGCQAAGLSTRGSTSSVLRSH